jgi:hypothetical protein
MTPTESTAESATHERPISVFDEHAGSADHALSRSTPSAPLDETFARAHLVSLPFRHFSLLCPHSRCRFKEG